MQSTAATFDPKDFRRALGMFGTGVTIVTTRAENGEPVGITANSFNSVSLEPPLVLWSLARASGSMPTLGTGSHYAINVLAADQKELAERFADASFRDALRGAADAGALHAALRDSGMAA